MPHPTWTPAALEKMKNVPFFIRPIAKAKIESEARARGVSEITVALIDEIRAEQHARR